MYENNGGHVHAGISTRNPTAKCDSWSIFVSWNNAIFHRHCRGCLCAMGRSDWMDCHPLGRDWRRIRRYIGNVIASEDISMIDNPLNRLSVKRGEQLPQSKLTDDDVRLIHAAVKEREYLRSEASKLTNKKLAEKFDVHIRTIEKAINGYSWSHIA